jgi:hypothetical protein
MEEASCTLTISVYDTERNEKAKLHREELVCRKNFCRNIDNISSLLMSELSHLLHCPIHVELGS